MVPFFPITMVLEDLTDLELEQTTSGIYHYSFFQPGDEYEWSRLHATTDAFANEVEALAHFRLEFGSADIALKQRCIFLRTSHNENIGSAMAWYGDGQFDDSYGRLHWVVIRPDFRGRGLGRQLIHFTVHQLREQYTSAYLTSQTTSYPAINIYLDLGFRPWIKSDGDQKAWEILKDLLQHSALLNLELYLKR